MGIVWIAKSSYNCYWGKGSLRWYYLLFLKRGKISDPIEATLSPQCEAAVLVAVGQFSLILSLPARITQYQSKSSAFSLPISTHV